MIRGEKPNVWLNLELTKQSLTTSHHHPTAFASGHPPPPPLRLQQPLTLSLSTTLCSQVTAQTYSRQSFYLMQRRRRWSAVQATDKLGCLMWRGWGVPRGESW